MRTAIPARGTIALLLGVFPLAGQPRLARDLDKGATLDQAILAALARMRTEHRPSLAFVLPKGDDDRYPPLADADRARVLDRLARRQAQLHGIARAPEGLLVPYPFDRTVLDSAEQRLLTYLRVLTLSDDAEVQSALLEAVCLCIPAAAANAEAGETLVLLDGQVAGRAVSRLT
jgi:hypothetical protein